LKAEKLLERAKHSLENIPLNEILNWKTAKTGEHCEIFVNVDVDLVQIVFILTAVIGHSPLTDFIIWRFALSDFHLHFIEAFEVITNNYDKINHFLDILFANVFFDVEVDALHEVH